MNLKQEEIMENIFNEVEFGDKFVTRDGRKAVYIGKWIPVRKGLSPIHKCYIEGDDDTTPYDDNGLSYPYETRIELDDGTEEEYSEDIMSKIQ